MSTRSSTTTATIKPGTTIDLRPILEAQLVEVDDVTVTASLNDSSEVLAIRATRGMQEELILVDRGDDVQLDDLLEAVEVDVDPGYFVSAAVSEDGVATVEITFETAAA